MKKLIVMLLAAVMVFALAACTPTTGNNESTAPSDSQPDDIKVMTHAEYAAAELDTKVVVETYVQTIESWWNGKCSIYAASEDGGYFIYDYACTEDEAAKLVAGTKIALPKITLFTDLAAKASSVCAPAAAKVFSSATSKIFS